MSCRRTIATALLPLVLAASVTAARAQASPDAAPAVRPATEAESSAFIEAASRLFRSPLSPDYKLPIRIDAVLVRGGDLPADMPRQTILVPAGVVPRGDPGEACLLYVDGLRASADRCWGDAGPAIARLARIDALPPPGGCRILSPDPSTSIQAASVAGAGASVHVHVGKAGEMLLVLDSAEPVAWQVSFGRGTLIRGVIVAGNGDSTVDGIDPNMPVIGLDAATRQLLAKADPACGPLFEQGRGAIRGGPDALLLDRQIRALAGRGLDGLTGALRASRVDLR